MARASSRSPSADRLVVLVHQHDRLLSGALVQDQFPETVRRLDGSRFEAGAPLRRRQLPFHGYPNPVRDYEIAPAEADPHEGAPTSPACRARRGPGTTPRFPAPAACPPAGSCRTGADATGNNTDHPRRGGAHSPSCRRSSSPAPGFSRGRSSRSEASVPSEGRPPCPSRRASGARQFLCIDAREGLRFLHVRAVSTSQDLKPFCGRRLRRLS